uniref:Secreted protein n=1 Tax=Mesocestoides corti TaxID=53468 RepID=A0A5K3FSY1_MESCO
MFPRYLLAMLGQTAFGDLMPHHHHLYRLLHVRCNHSHDSRQIRILIAFNGVTSLESSCRSLSRPQCPLIWNCFRRESRPDIYCSAKKLLKYIDGN